MDEIAVGQIGYGYWGPNLARQFSMLPGSRLSVLADQSPERRERAARALPGTRVVDRVEDVLEGPDTDAVVLATPTRAHTEHALRALRAGKHVFVEKPLAPTVEESEAIICAARDAGRICMVGYLLLYHPAFQRLESMVRGGDLGRIFTLESERTNLGTVQADENTWWRNGPHDLAMILQLVDSSPVWVTSFGQSFLRPGVEDVVFAGLRFESGAIASIHVSWLSPHRRRRLSVVGSKAMAVFDDAEVSEKLRIYDRGVDYEPSYGSYGESLAMRFGDILIPAVASTEPLLIECQEFLDCIRDGREPRTSAAHSLAVDQVLAAADRSLRSGQPVELAPV